MKREPHKYFAVFNSAGMIQSRLFVYPELAVLAVQYMNEDTLIDQVCYRHRHQPQAYCRICHAQENRNAS